MFHAFDLSGDFHMDDYDVTPAYYLGDNFMDRLMNEYKEILMDFASQYGQYFDPDDFFGSGYYSGSGSNTDTYSGYSGSGSDTYSGYGTSTDSYSGYDSGSGSNTDTYSGYNSGNYSGYGSTTDSYSGYNSGNYSGTNTDTYSGYSSGSGYGSGAGKECFFKCYII